MVCFLLFRGSANSGGKGRWRATPARGSRGERTHAHGERGRVTPLAQNFCPFFYFLHFSRSFFVKFKAWILTIVNHILRHHEVFHVTHECSSSSLSQRFVLHNVIWIHVDVHVAVVKNESVFLECLSSKFFTEIARKCLQLLLTLENSICLSSLYCF